MKKTLAVLLSVVMLLGCLSTGVFAASTASDSGNIVTVDLSSEVSGGSIAVKVTMTPKNSGDVIAAYNLKLQYDDSLVEWDQNNANSIVSIDDEDTQCKIRFEYDGKIKAASNNQTINTGTVGGKPTVMVNMANAKDGFTKSTKPVSVVFYFTAKSAALINGADAVFTLLTEAGTGHFGCNTLTLSDRANHAVSGLTETSLSTTAEIAGKTVTGITLTAPTKVAYSYGDALALAGMKVTATFEDNSTAEITDGFTCSPADGAALKVSDTKVTVTYKGKTAEQAITVAKKALTVTGLTATNRAYDGTTAVALSGGALSGALTGDAVTATMPTAGTIADANAGTGKAVTFTAIALTGADAANYTVTQPTVTVNITKATLTAADFDLPTVEAVEYNGQPQSVAAPTLKSGKTGAGAVTVKYAGSTTAPTNYGEYAITFDVAEGTNYNAATGLAIGTLRISKTLAKVTTAPTAKTLTYTGSEQALITAGAADTAMEYSRTEDGTYTAAIPAETAAGTYEVWYRAAADNDHDASTAKKLTVTIAKATPTVTAPTGKTDLTYSGSNQALIEAGSTTGGTLQYSIDGTTYSAKVPSAKDAKTYTVSYKVVGNDNYSDVDAKIVTATIIPKALTVTGLTATNRAYDGTTTVALTGGSLTGIEGSDTVTATMPTTGTIADANVGTGKAVTFTAIALTGADAANYTVIQPTVTVDITKATLTAADFDLPTLTDPEYNGQPQTVAAPTLKSGKTGAGAVTVKYGGSTTAPTAYGTYAITFDVAEGTNYEAATGLSIGSMSITKTKAKVTTAPTVKTLTYDGTEQALITAGVADTAMEYSETQDGTYAATIPAKTAAGTYEVWYRAAADDNHAVSVAQKLTIAIAKKTVTVTGITAEDKVYDGKTTATLNYANPTFEGIVSGDTLTVAAATGAFADANAGENKTVTITGIELGGASKDNYQLSATTATATATIAKKTINPQVTIAGWTYGETAKTPVLTGNTGNGAVTYTYKVKNAADDTYTATVPTDANTYTLKATIAETANTSAGTATAEFTIAKATNPAVIPLDTVKVKVGGTRDLAALITNNQGGAIMLSAAGTLPTGATLTDGVLTAGDATGTFDVVVAIAENDNYLAKTDSFSVEITEKEPQDISYAETTVEKTYGDAAFTNPLTKTKAEGAITYESSVPAVATVDETGKVTILKGGETTIKATAAATAEYAEQTASYVLKVEKKPVTVKAIDRTIYVNGTVPDLSAPAKNTDYQVLGLIGDDELDLTTPITMAYKKDGAAADPDNTKTGTYAITVAGGAVPDTDKYKSEIEYVEGTLTITTAPVYDDEPTTSDDTASVTTSAEVKDGEAKATVDEQTVTDALKGAEDADALTVKVDTKDADSVEAGLSADAVKAAAEADVDLHVETENGTIKLDNDVLKDAAESGKDVAVTVKQNANGTTTFNVTAGGESVEIIVKVELPAPKRNEVLKIVKEDGTEEVVKKSISEDGVVYAEIPAGATVKVEEVESEFTDVDDDDWFAEEVDFVADRGIFNGMTETEFEPETNMSRAMLATVLYRLENAEATGVNPFGDVADGQWFTDGVVWAAGAGIVNGTGDGFDPDENVSREQIAAMLHRYVQYLGLDIGGSADLSQYTDGDQVSNWAKDDMAWAVSVGLFQGNGDGTLNPTGDATRAEVAALIQRLVALIVK